MFSFEKMLAWQKAIEYDIAHGSLYEVVSILAILQRREQVGREEFGRFYKQGDELAAIIYGLQKAALEAAAKQGAAPRTLREASARYGEFDDDTDIL